MANVYTAFRTNFIAILKADAVLIATLANGSTDVVVGWPARVAKKPLLSYLVTNYTPVDQTVSVGLGPTRITITLSMHGRDADVIDPIHAALDSLANNDDKLGNPGLSSADVAVTGFGEINTVAEFDGTMDGREQVDEFRTRTYECVIVDPNPITS